MPDQAPFTTDERGIITSLGKKEEAFLKWYKAWAAKTGLSPDPNPDLHFYDYRAAYMAGEYPKIGKDGVYHWDSRFKFTKEKQGVDHPNRFVEGQDTTMPPGTESTSDVSAWKEGDVWPPQEEEDVEEVTVPQEQRPGQNVFDPGYAAFLQEEGLIDVQAQEKYIKDLKPMPAGQQGPGDPVWALRNIPVNVAEDMHKDYAGFLKGEGWSLVNDPLPPMQRGEAADLAKRTAEEYRALMIQQYGATIGPQTRAEAETAARASMVSPTATAQQLGQPTIGTLRRATPPSVMEEVGRRREAATKVVFWKQIGEGLDQLIHGDGRGWGKILAAGPEDTKRFWLQVKDVASLIGKGQWKNSAAYTAEALATGVTLGIVTPEVLDKVDDLFKKLGLTDAEYKTLKMRREEILGTLGYYPTRPATVLSGVAYVIPVSKVAAAAKVLGGRLLSVPATERLLHFLTGGRVAATSPFAQRVATAGIGGGITGVADYIGKKISEDKPHLTKDLEVIPTHMLYWSLFELGSLGVETAAKIVNWNLKYGGKISGTGEYGGYGQGMGVQFEPVRAPGQPPRTIREFTGAEIRDLFREIPVAERSYIDSVTARIREDSARVAEGTRLQTELSDLLRQDPLAYARRIGIEEWKIQVYSAIGGANGWNQALRRGWIPPQPIEIPGTGGGILGYRTMQTGQAVPPSIGGEAVPMKPDWGMIFREGGALREWPFPESYAAPGAPGQPLGAGGAIAPAAPPAAGAPPPGEAPPPGVGAGPRPRPQAPPPPPPPVTPPPPPPPGAAPPPEPTPPPAAEVPPPPAAERPPIVTPPPPYTAPPPDQQARQAFKEEGLSKKRRQKAISAEVDPLNNAKGRLSKAQEARQKELMDEWWEIEKWLKENDIPNEEPETFDAIYPRVGMTVYRNGQPVGTIRSFGYSNMQIDRLPGVPPFNPNAEIPDMLGIHEFNDPDAEFSFAPDRHLGGMYNHRDGTQVWPEHDADAVGNWKDPTMPPGERLKGVEQRLKELKQLRKDIQVEIDGLHKADLKSMSPQEKLAFREKEKEIYQRHYALEAEENGARKVWNKLKGKVEPRVAGEGWPPPEWVPQDPETDEPYDWEVTLEEFKRNPLMEGEDPDAIVGEYYDSLGMAIQDGDYIPVQVLDAEKDFVEEFLEDEENWTTIDKRGEVITGTGEKAAPLVNYYDRTGQGKKPKYLTEDQLGTEGQPAKKPIVTPPPGAAPPPPTTPPPAEAPVTEPKVKFKVTPTEDGGVIVESMPKAEAPPIAEPRVKPPVQTAYGSLKEFADDLKATGDQEALDALDSNLARMYNTSLDGKLPDLSPEDLDFFIKNTLDKAERYRVQRKEAGIPRPAAKPVEQRAPVTRDQALRDAVERVRNGTASPTDIELVSQAALRSERLRGLAEGYKGIARTDYLTQVGSDAALKKIKGWEKLPQIRLDLKKVKESNDTQGHDWTDQNIFVPAGKVFRENGRGRAFRKGGNADEFVILGEKGETIEALVGRANKIMRELNAAGVQARMAVGRNGMEAEDRLTAIKKSEGKVEAEAPKPKGETPEEHTRRILKSRREAMKKRVKVGVPKDLLENDPLIKDIFRITSGIRPIMSTGDWVKKGTVAEEYRSLPKWIKNKNGMAIDDLQERLNRLGEERGEAGYGFGIAGNPELLDVLQGYARNEYWNRRQGPPPERDAEDWAEIAKEHEAQRGRRASIAEEAGLKTKEETYDQFLERMAIEADSMGMGEDEAWRFVEAKIQAHEAYKNKYKPIMNEGESFFDFLLRMEKEAVAAGMFPEEALNYADDLLKKKVGGSEGGAGGASSPALITLLPAKASGPGAKGSGWFSNKFTPSGKPVAVTDPPLITPGQNPNIFSSQIQLDVDDFKAVDIPQMEITLRRWQLGQDPGLEKLLEAIKREFVDTYGYNQGLANNIPYIPPGAFRIRIEKNFDGPKGLRMFQLKWVLFHDAVARLSVMAARQGSAFQPPIIRGVGAFHMLPLKPPHPMAGSVVGAQASPGSGEIFINPWIAENNVLNDPWRAAQRAVNVLGHEFTHWFEPDHNERFTSILEAWHQAMEPIMPRVIRIAEALTGRKADIDLRQTVIILDDGRSAPVDNALIRTMGNDVAKLTAERSLNNGDPRLYGKGGEPKALIVRGPKRPGEGGGEPGEPGPTGLPGAGGGPGLPYPPSAPQAGPKGVGVRPGRDVGREIADAHGLTTIPQAYDWALDDRSHGDEVFSRAAKDVAQKLYGTTDPYKIPKGDKMEAAKFLSETNRRANEIRAEEFQLTPTVEAPPPFKPTEFIGEQRILPLEAQGKLFEGQPAEGPAEKKKQGDLFLVKQAGKYKLREDALAQQVNIWDDVWRLTTGPGFPREWLGKTTDEIQANRQALAEYVAANWSPPWGRIEDFVNQAKGYFRAGELRPARMPEYPEGGPLPKKAVPIPAPRGFDVEAPTEIPDAKPKPNVFGRDMINAQNSLRAAAERAVKNLAGVLKAGGKADTAKTISDVDAILKSRILNHPPESPENLAKRLGLSKPLVDWFFEQGMREIANDPKLMEDVKDWLLTQANLGPAPSEADLRRWAKILRTYFSSQRGADKVIDMRNDTRIGQRMREVFEQTLDSAVLDKWMREQPAGTDTYVHSAFTGAQTGNGYNDIQNLNIPQNIKDVLLKMRERIDRLSELIVAHGGLSNETKTAINNNMGKYLTKAYRLWEDKHWDPTPAQRQGFKDFLMQNYRLTDAQAENFMEQELAYARNDEGLLPKRKRKTRRVPTEHYIRRKDLSPEWRAFAGQIDRTAWLALKTVSKQATMAYNAEFLDWIMNYLPEHWTGSLQTARERGWQNSKFQDDYAYGKLADKWVDPEFHKYIKAEIDVSRSDIEEIVQNVLMNPFKWTKTIGSWPTHMRNFLGNTAFSILANTSIINPMNAKWYRDALDILANKKGSRRADFADMIGKGVTETQFYGNDIPQIYKELMKFDDPDWMEKLYDRLIRRPIDKMGEIYNFEDQLYRIAAYRKMTAPTNRGGQGMTPDEALEEINSAMQNYRKLPVAVDILRRWPVLGPFVSFKWNVAKIVGLQAKKGVEELFTPPPPPPGAPPGWRPSPGDAARRKWRGAKRLLKLALVLSIPTILSELSKITNDVDDEDIKRLERFYPDYRRNGTFFYFRDKNGELKVFDFQYLWPSGDLERTMKALAKGDVKSLSDSLDFFSHPLFDIWSIVVQGRDPAFGTTIRPGGFWRDIYDTAVAAARYLYLPSSMPIPNLEGLLQGKDFGPAMIPDPNNPGKMIENPQGGNLRPGNLTGPQFKAIIDAYNNGTDRYERYKSLPEEIKNFFTGIRTWSVEPDKLLAQAAVVRNAQIMDAQRRLSRWTAANKNAPAWEKKNHLDMFLEEIAQPTADLKEIGTLLQELKSGNFAIRKRQ